MKQTKLLSLFLFAFMSLTIITSCSDSDDKREIREFQLTVASVKRLMFVTDHYSPYFVKYEGENEWKPFPYITNFTLTEGYEYVIRVRSERVVFEDMEGGSPYEITLLEEISKTQKVSENIPPQRGYIVIGSKKTGDENNPYYMRELGKGYWVKFPGILEDFDYEEGYEYIVELDYQFNGSTDINKYLFSFVKIQRKDKTDSVNLPS